MTRVLGYTKKFIILKKDFSNMEGNKAKGHGKLEIKGLKGNLSISLENAEIDQNYNVLFVEGDKTYNIGKVYTENNGKSKEEIEFNISDLEAKGLSLDRINGILIIRDKNVLLGEYIGKDNGCLERYIKSQIAAAKEESQEELDYQEEIEVQDESELMETQPPIEPEYILEPEPVFHYETEEFEPGPEVVAIEVDEGLEYQQQAQEDLQTEESIPEEIINEQKVEPQEVILEELEPEFEPVPDPEEIMPQEILAEDDFVADFQPIGDLGLESEPIAVEAEPQEEVSAKEYNNDYNRKVTQRNQTTKYILSILRYFPYVDPFRVNLSGYNWWRIDYQDDGKGFLPFFGYVINSEKSNQVINKDVTANELMEVHEHYIFGLYNMGDEVKYYVYGIPGGFHIDEHPYGGDTGFNTWFEGSDIPGYWLIYIDPLTGEVMKPINPMEPTD